MNIYHDLASGVRDHRPELDNLPCGSPPARAAQIDTTTVAGRLVFGIFAALAESSSGS